LFIVKPPPSKYSPEEAKQKAKELQAEIRRKREEREKQETLESEKARLLSGKNLTDALRQQEEQKVKNAMADLQREREEEKRAKAKVLAELEKDRMEKFGKNYVKKAKPAPEVFSDMYNKMTKIYPIGSIEGEKLKTCLKTIKIYLSKIQTNHSQFPEGAQRAQVPADQHGEQCIQEQSRPGVGRPSLVEGNGFQRDARQPPPDKPLHCRYEPSHGVPGFGQQPTQQNWSLSRT
jgi:hypothetical protein